MSKSKLSLPLALLFIIILNNVSCVNIVSTQTPDELSCDQNPIYRNLEISTKYSENSKEYSVIMKDCRISDHWRVKEETKQQCQIPLRAFEGEDNIRRSFKFTYNKNAIYKDKIVIKKITLNYPKSVAEPVLTKDSLTLYPGESIDLYVDYYCLDMDENKRGASDWYKITFDIEFENGQHKLFEFIKICTASYADKLDFSHLLIIGCIFLIIYASFHEYLKSKIEGIIVEKFIEIKNPENLLVMSFVIGILLIFLGVVNMYDKWIYIILFIVSPLSLSMILEALLKRKNILDSLETKSFEIPYVGSLTLSYIVCLTSGLFIHLIWIKSRNWLIGNIIAIAISIITIRIFKFTSFKFLSAVYVFTSIYEYLWVYYRSNYYDENYKLTNSTPQDLPVRIVCPELISSPFSACNYLPIADVILPGLLLMYARKFEEDKNSANYFKYGLGALGAGLIINLFVYYNMNLPTPSFLFTGPLILIVVLANAQNQNEMFDFIMGFQSTHFKNRCEENLEKFREFEKNRKDSGGYQPPRELDNLSDRDENAVKIKNTN
jgi:hypothetical protein